MISLFRVKHIGGIAGQVLQKKYFTNPIRNFAALARSLHVFKFTGPEYQLASIPQAEVSKHLPDLSKRDVSTIDDSSSHHISLILARRTCVVLKLEHLKIVVDNNSMVLFDANLPLVEDVAKILKHNISNLPHGYPYELCVLETVLRTVMEEFEHRYQILVPIVHRTIESSHLEPKPGSSGTVLAYEYMKRLVALTSCLSKFDDGMREFSSAIDDILNSEKNLKTLNISKRKEGISPIDTEESQQILHSYAKKAEEMENGIDHLRSVVSQTTKVTELSLDAYRNTIMN